MTEIPSGGQSLEDDDPVPAPAPVAEPPPEPAPAAEPPPPAEVDVPLAALKDERAKRQSAEQRAQDLERTNAQLQRVLDAQQQVQRERERAVPVGELPPDPRALAVAKELDFYTKDGEPDVARGARHLAMIREEARAIADEVAQPERARSLQVQAQANLQAALAIKDTQGRSINPTALKAVWQQVMDSPNGVAILADKEAAAFVAAAAHGAIGLTSPAGPLPVVPPAQPPLVTESAGGGPPRRAPISDLERKVAAERGRDTEKWSALTKTHVSGRPNQLED